MASSWAGLAEGCTRTVRASGDENRATHKLHKAAVTKLHQRRHTNTTVRQRCSNSISVNLGAHHEKQRAEGKLA